jgi:hypothetical protein
MVKVFIEVFDTFIPKNPFFASQKKLKTRDKFVFSSLNSNDLGECYTRYFCSNDPINQHCFDDGLGFVFK